MTIVKKSKRRQPEDFRQAISGEAGPIVEPSSDEEGHTPVRTPGCPHCEDASKFPNCIIPVHEDCGGTLQWDPHPFLLKLSQDPIHMAKVPRPRLLTDPELKAEILAFVLEMRCHRFKKQRLQYRVGAWGL
jgi:hypothetical protein